MKFYNRNGTLYIRVNGIRKSTKLPDTPNNRKLVKSYHKNDEFFNSFSLNTNVPKFVDICIQVLDDKQIKPTSYKCYQSMLNNKIIPFFKDMLVNEIKPKHILQWYSTFIDSSSITTSLAIVKPAFQKAVINDFISSSPVTDVPRPKFEKKYHMQPFTLSEIDIILNNCEDITFKNFLGLAFFTGARSGELIGLKWTDIDFENFTISISRTVTKGFEQTPKSLSSIRTIDMLPQAEYFLKDQYSKTGLSKYVFLTKKNKRFNGSENLSAYFKKYLKELGIKQRSIYQTRHTFASNMLSNGEDLLWVSTMLGHKSANITLSKYSRYIKTHKARKTTFLDTKATHIG